MNSIIKLKEISNVEQAIDFLKKSKIGNLFTNNVSEISFNGEDLYLFDNELGRSKVKGLSLNNDEAYFIVKHLADISGKVFNNLNPILDLSFGNYRLNAIHESIAVKMNGGVTSFIIRQIFKGLRIDNNKTRIDSAVENLLSKILESKQSVIISGVTGSGKTELQKYLVSKLEVNQRIIMIEETYETHIKELFTHLDINVWELKGTLGLNQQIGELIRAGLRNNPDWLMLAETRGSETSELLLTATSGIPIITTIHAQSASNAIERMIQLIGGSSRFKEDYLEKEIANHIHWFVHMTKKQNKAGKIERKIGQIMVCYVNNSKVIRKIIFDEYANKKYQDLDKIMAARIKIKEQWYET